MILERFDWIVIVLIVVVDGGNFERSVIFDILVWLMNDKSICVVKSSKFGFFWNIVFECLYFFLGII